MSDRAPSLMMPALIGGGLGGLLSGIPKVGALNCACCALIASGGFLAAFLYSRQCESFGSAFTAGSGAKVGLAAAPVYAVIHTILLAVAIAVGGLDLVEIEERLEANPDVSPEMIEGILGIFESLSGVGGAFMVLIMTLILGAIFSTLGGLIGGAVFKKEAQAAPQEPPLGA